MAADGFQVAEVDGSRCSHWLSKPYANCVKGILVYDLRFACQITHIRFDRGELPFGATWLESTVEVLDISADGQSVDRTTIAVPINELSDISCICSNRLLIEPLLVSAPLNVLV